MVICKECNEEKELCPKCFVCGDCEGSCEFCELTVRPAPGFETITKGIALWAMNQVRRLLQLDSVLVCFLNTKEDDGYFWLWDEPHKGFEAVFILDPRGMLVVSAIHEGLHVLFPAMDEEDLAYLAIQVVDRLSEDQIYNFLVDILEKMEKK